MKKIGIVILNYLNYKDTIECVESALNLSYPSIALVVVDNGSPNGSGAVLKQRFGDDPRITLLCTGENLGFAKGNNIGITFCTKYKQCDYVLIVNSDTLFDQEDFIQQLLASVPDDQPVGAIGPKIINSDGTSSNPIPIDMNGKRIVKDLMINFAIILGVYSFIKKAEEAIVKRADKPADRPLLSSEHKPFLLHGSALLLTPLYLASFRGLYPGTFLYYEENILGIIFKKNGLKFYYQPAARLLHKGDGSSKLSNNNSSRINARRHLGSIARAARLLAGSRASVNRSVNRISDGEREFYRNY